MTRRWRNLLKARDGMAAMEFAIAATALMMLTLGTIEFARLLWTQEALDATAIQTARCIGVLASSCTSGGSYSEDNTKTYAEQVATGWGITLTDADITPSDDETTGPCASGVTTLAQVSISYTFQSVVPGLLSMLAGGEALTSQACFAKQS
jgi:Flp pilus assembly protein TadG